VIRFNNPNSFGAVFRLRDFTSLIHQLHAAAPLYSLMGINCWSFSRGVFSCLCQSSEMPSVDFDVELHGRAVSSSDRTSLFEFDIWSHLMKHARSYGNINDGTHNGSIALDLEVIDPAQHSS
jgi:hypothetical protein